jgi:lysophospholipase L1-like esterase
LRDPAQLAADPRSGPGRYGGELLLGRRIRFVDQYPNFVNADGTIETALLPDGVHPNQAGYDLMAGTGSDAIEALL